MSSPALNILRTLRWMPIKFSGKIRIFELLMSVESLSNFVFIHMFICFCHVDQIYFPLKKLSLFGNNIFNF